MSNRKLWTIGIGIICTIVMIIAWDNILIRVAETEQVVITSLISGTQRVVREPGPVFIWGDYYTRYPKRDEYAFTNVPIRFNDAGAAGMSGTQQFTYPVSDALFIRLHNEYRSPNGVKEGVIRVATNRGIKFSGVLMSTRESVAERRNELHGFCEDQINLGLYETVATDTTVTDVMTGESRTVKLVEVVFDANGLAVRIEEPIIAQFGLITSNFAITKISYEAKVKEQIDAQRDNQMKVQTAMTLALEAEQKAKTAEATGKATAMEAKWAQEKIKATEVTKAEQLLEVAKLDKLTAEQFKAAEILRGQGEAERKRLNMAADGQLKLRLEAYVKGIQAEAKAMGQYKGNLTPTTVFGNSGNGNGLSNPNHSVIGIQEYLQFKIAEGVGLNAKTLAALKK